MAERPVWHAAGNDASAVAQLLERAAGEATTLTFDDRPAPGGIPAGVLHQAALLVAQKRLARSHGEADRVLAQEVRAIDDLVRAANLLVERLREWYALHAPEATRAIGDPEALARLVAEHGDRASVLAALDHADQAAASVGTDLDPADIAVVQGFAAALRGVHQSWRAIERRVHDAMAQVAPNVQAVVGPVLGARLIAQAGSLQRLATMSSGTVQTLGAETALFRHLKEGTLPPKHGLLFQHPRVHQAPPWQRGAIARTLALHVTTAARADAFTKNDLRGDLAQGLEKDLARIARERNKPRRQAPRRDGTPRRQEPGGPRRSGPRSPGPRTGGAARGKGPARGGPGPKGPPGQPYKPRKPQGAFRKTDRGGGPAKPPGKGGR